MCLTWLRPRGAWIPGRATYYGTSQNNEAAHVECGEPAGQFGEAVLATTITIIVIFSELREITFQFACYLHKTVV